MCLATARVCTEDSQHASQHSNKLVSNSSASHLEILHVCSRQQAQLVGLCHTNPTQQRVAETPSAYINTWSSGRTPTFANIPRHQKQTGYHHGASCTPACGRGIPPPSCSQPFRPSRHQVFLHTFLHRSGPGCVLTHVCCHPTRPPQACSVSHPKQQAIRLAIITTLSSDHRPPCVSSGAWLLSTPCLPSPPVPALKPKGSLTAPQREYARHSWTSRLNEGICQVVVQSNYEISPGRTLARSTRNPRSWNGTEISQSYSHLVHNAAPNIICDDSRAAAIRIRA